MDRDLFNPQRDMGGQNLKAFDQVSSRINSSPLTESQPSDINNQWHFEPQYSTLSRVQGEPISNFHDEIPITNYQGACETTIDSLLPITRRSRIELREHLTRGLPVSPTLSGVLLTTSGLHESLNDLTVPEPSVSPSELLRTYILSDCSNTSSSSYASSLECVYDRTQGDVHNRWDFKKFPLYADLSGETACFQPPQLIGNLDSGEWNKNDGNVSADDPFRSSEFTNDLSLSLASSQPSMICGPTIPDQCSETICSNANQNSCNQMRFSSEQASCSNKEVSLCPGFGSYRSGHMSQPSSVWSRYLFAIQEILSEIASLTLNNTEQMSCSTSGLVSEAPLADETASVMEFDKFPDGDIRFEVRMEPVWPTQEAEARKAQMLDLLRVVDYQYNHFLDEIHTVISAFHAATELNPQIHSRFALRNLSFLYKNLRERISNQILAMGTHISGEGDRRGKNKSFESSFMQREWTIQQLKRKEHQLWRPQRGLPERSVSVLRAWMFQNFLHPYPKDAEKHILAVKSGLTRSQVSNWFINARVRLWKPLIEEMYAEVDRRKAHPNSMKNQGFRLN